MPTYGYHCSRGHRWEVVQRITEAPLTQCAECGAPATRVFYPVGIVFKGQGFYKTDSRGSGGIPAGNVGDGAGDKDGKSGDKDGKSSGDGKPGGDASKTDTKAKTSTDSGSKSDSKSDTAASPPPAKTEEK